MALRRHRAGNARHDNDSMPVASWLPGSRPPGSDRPLPVMLSRTSDTTARPLLFQVSGYCGRGSPRAFRAGPSAWPSPSGPQGWQRSPGSTARRRRVPRSGMRSTVEAGGASPDNARRSGPVSVTLSLGDWRTWAMPTGLASSRSERPTARYGGVCAAAGVRGVGAGAAARDGALSRKRKRAAARHLRRGSLSSLAATAQHSSARSRTSCTSCSSFASFGTGRVGVARRRCALEAVEKVVTAFGKGRRPAATWKIRSGWCTARSACHRE
jgi:hypothetical protein